MSSQLKWIDIHTHLNFLDISPEEAIKNAAQQGVERIITIGTEPKDWPMVLGLSQKFSGQVFCTLGLHPHEAHQWTNEEEKFLEKNWSRPEVVALGEMGLDFYYDHSPREKQKDVFRRQIELALKANLPVEIHTRDAEEETIEILSEFKGSLSGLLHCFTGSQFLADEALKLGLNISISGIVTFKKADEIRQVVKSIPLDRLHVETDAPYLAPMPHRGKQNQPAFVVHTAEMVAQIKEISLSELAEQTKANALKMFPKLDW